MNKYSIGFRLNFQNMDLLKVEKFLISYLSNFDRYEIKINSDFISSLKCKQILEVSSRLAKGRYSIHLPKNLFLNNIEYERTIQFIKELEATEDCVYLVTHIPYDINKKFLKEFDNLLASLPENYVVLLENQLSYNNTEYFNSIDRFFSNYTSVLNVGFCLDLGHMLFGFWNEKTESEKVFYFLSNLLNIMNKVKEIHIHDYLNKDHLLLGDGIMNLNMTSSFICDNFKVPIILEVNANNNYVGMEQVKLLNRCLMMEVK